MLLPQHVLLLIDAQHDFCYPMGALFVSGADADMKRLGHWIDRQGPSLHSLVATLDWHEPLAISHPRWFVDGEGQHPAPFTAITAEDVQMGRWLPTDEPLETLVYLKALAQQGNFRHTIWPEPCLPVRPGLLWRQRFGRPFGSGNSKLADIIRQC